MKLKRHECKSLKEFNKIVRKYIKYFSPRFNHNYHLYWYTWVWYDAVGVFAINALYPYAKKLAAQNQPNLLHIIDTVMVNYDWSFTHKNGKKYYLRGIEISNEDYYYIYVSEFDKLYSSCVGKFTDVGSYCK